MEPKQFKKIAAMLCSKSVLNQLVIKIQKKVSFKIPPPSPI